MPHLDRGAVRSPVNKGDLDLAWRLRGKISTMEYSTDVSTTSANRTGSYLAVLQLVFTLGWTIYLIYLPELASEVGIAPSAAMLILLLDQAIFAVSDTAMGIAADKIGPVVGRLGLFVGVLTALSCTAFVALPFVAGTGPGAQVWFIVCIVVWTSTSSALRAPPLTLLKRRPRPSIPLLATLAMVGYGLAGAVSPYVGAALSGYDARFPFVISSVVLLITTLALSPIERGLARKSPAHETPRETAKPLGRASIVFIASMVLLALGSQLHLSVNSAPLFFQFVKPGDIEWWVSVFWIGFNLAMFPASIVVGRRGGLIVMGIAGLLGAAGLARRGIRRQPQHADRSTVLRRRGLGLHDDERDLGGAGDRRMAGRKARCWV